MLRTLVHLCRFVRGSPTGQLNFTLVSYAAQREDPTCLVSPRTRLGRSAGGRLDDGRAVPPPVAFSLEPLGAYDAGVAGGAEIVAYDDETARMFVTNGANVAIDIIDIVDPSAPILVESVDLTPYGAIVQSVATNRGRVAAAARLGGAEYLVTANEGDARDYDCFSEEIRVGDVGLGAAYGDGDDDNAVLGRLRTTDAFPTTLDADGRIEQVYAYGARSFSIRTTDGQQVFDSGDEFAQRTATWALRPSPSWDRPPVPRGRHCSWFPSR